MTGTGALRNLINNGNVTPGVNGVGTMTASSYSGPGSLNISFTGRSHTSLRVLGNADLTGGTLNLSGTSFSIGQYRLLTADSISGTFITFNSPSSAFLAFLPQYTHTDVMVLISFIEKFSSVAQTGNQEVVAVALDAPKTTPTTEFVTAINAISLLTASQARDAYNQISGDSLASFQDVSLRNTASFTSHMRAREDAVETIHTARALESVQLAYAGDMKDLGLARPPVGESVPSYGFWTRGVGFFDNVHANASVGSPESHATTGGFQAGYDFLLDESIVLGLSGGYARTSLSVDDRSSSGQTISIQSGIYARYRSGAWFVDGSLAYTSASNEMIRIINFPGINEQSNSNFQSRTYASFVEAGYTFRPWDIFLLEPSASLSQSHLQQDSFTESGAPGLDLSVADQSVNSLVSALSVHLSHQFVRKSSHPFTLGIRMAWQHELSDINSVVSADFAEASGNPFTVQGTPRARNAAALGLDGHMVLYKNLQAFADYSATLSSGQNAQGIVGGLSLNW